MGGAADRAGAREVLAELEVFQTLFLAKPALKGGV